MRNSCIDMWLTWKELLYNEKGEGYEIKKD